MRVKKYCDYYYQVIKVECGFGWRIYNGFGKDKELLEQNDEICATETEAEGDARDAISYHYI
jgi:hypothetical protein